MRLMKYRIACKMWALISLQLAPGDSTEKFLPDGQAPDRPREAAMVALTKASATCTKQGLPKVDRQERT